MTATRSGSSHAAVGISTAAIVDQALTVIAEHGVAGLTMRALADRLGIRAPSLYHHVRNKDELLRLIAGDTFAAFSDDRAEYERVETVADWIALTTAGTRRLREFYTRHPGLAGLIQATATPDRDEGQGTRASLIRAQVGALVRLGVPAGAAREFFATCAHWTLAAVAAESTTDRRDPERDDLRFDRGLDWLMRGLRIDLDQILESRRLI